MGRIEDDIKKHTFSSLYLIMGDDVYLSSRYEKMLRLAILGSDGPSMNYAFFTGKDVNPVSVMDFARAVPMFAEKRMVVLENTDMVTSPSDAFRKFLKNIPDTAVVVIVQRSLKKTSSVYKTASKTGVVVDLDDKRTVNHRAMVESWLKEHNCTMDRDLIGYFLNRTGADTGLIERELSKLYDYKSDETPVVITRDDIDTMTTVSLEDKIFDMFSAALAGDADKTYMYYRDLLELKESGVKIVKLLTKQINDVFRTREQMRKKISPAQAARNMHMPEWRYKKITGAAGRISFARLMYLMNLGADLENDILTGRTDDKSAAENLIAACISAAE